MSGRKRKKPGTPPEVGCAPRGQKGPPLTTYKAVARDYVANFRANLRSDPARYAAMPDLETAIANAASCTNAKGKRHSHQYRVPRKALDMAAKRLAKADLDSCGSFEELHDRVEAATGEIHRFGPLTVYDVSLRIGAFLGLAPEKVYLHTGAKKGAMALGLGRGRHVLEVSELPVPFRRLPPAEIEDLLCIYKTELRAIHDAETGCGEP